MSTIHLHPEYNPNDTETEFLCFLNESDVDYSAFDEDNFIPFLFNDNPDNNITDENDIKPANEIINDDKNENNKKLDNYAISDNENSDKMVETTNIENENFFFFNFGFFFV